ncbi:LysR substrate-binding domain-containing protein [Variovorax saccharolyticus]|uniref:LysR substrate-binding domain-containing protein n=1 Tax=Variovorax saccharolyticus TaxID=3053516 RepID=UPI002576BB17|nr:LysR substrate-binding domain-containing protein [Variovorax sp. J22R187]MDM0018777.1 LysR substrate-binding domain-containing protein [Variovorax sp. J22R187]
MRYFVKIVEAGSFSRAAATIFVAQPALSQQIAELEDELGVSLLHRSARGVRPTAAGEALYREAVAILRQIEKLPDIVRFTGGEVAGAVSLGMSSTLASFLAGELMKACKTALPMVNLSFVTEDSVSLKARVAAHTLDLAILFEEAPTPGLVRQPLFRQRLYLVERKPSARAGPKSVSLAEAGARPLVLPSLPNAMRSLLDQHFAAAGIAPEVVAEANMLHGILSAVQSGLGATVVPMGDFKAATGGMGLVAIPIRPAIHQTAHAVWSDGVPLTRAGEAVRGLLGPFVLRFLDEQAPLGMERIEG